jgi:hypothetical protein
MSVEEIERWVMNVGHELQIKGFRKVNHQSQVGKSQAEIWSTIIQIQLSIN